MPTTQPMTTKGRSVSWVFAASNSSATAKAGADQVLPGTEAGDTAAIAAAITAVGTGGKILFRKGTYNISTITTHCVIEGEDEVGTIFVLTNTLAGANRIVIHPWGSIQNVSIQAPSAFAGSALVVEALGEGFQPTNVLLVDNNKIIDNVSLYCPTVTGKAIYLNAAASGGILGDIGLCTFGRIFIRQFQYGVKIYPGQGVDSSHKCYINSNVFENITTWNTPYPIHLDRHATDCACEGNVFLSVTQQAGADTVDGITVAANCQYNQFVSISPVDLTPASQTIVRVAGNHNSFKGYFGSDSRLIVDTGLNNTKEGILPWSIDWANISSDNMLINSCFEQGVNFWTPVSATLVTESSIVKSGKRSALLTATAGFGYCYQDILDFASFSGDYITLGAWLRLPDNTGTTGARITLGDESTTTVGDYLTTELEWRWMTVTHLCKTSPTRLRCIVQIPTSGDAVYIDGKRCVRGKYCPPTSVPPIGEAVMNTDMANLTYSRNSEVIWGQAGEALTLGHIVYLSNDGGVAKWFETDADAYATTDGPLGLVTASVADDEYLAILRKGYFRYDALWTFTNLSGSPWFVSPTKGLIADAATINAATGAYKRRVGYGWQIGTADILEFDPDGTIAKV